MDPMTFLTLGVTAVVAVGIGLFFKWHFVGNKRPHTGPDTLG